MANVFIHGRSPTDAQLSLRCDTTGVLLTSTAIAGENGEFLIVNQEPLTEPLGIGGSINTLSYGFNDDNNTFGALKIDNAGNLKVNIAETDTIVSTNAVINDNNYDLQLAGALLYADSSPPFTTSPDGSDGWYYQSVNEASASNVYFYGNNALYQQSDIIYNTVQSVFSVVDLSFIGTLSTNLPILVVGTQPTGSGDAIPTFSHSVQTYSIPTNETLILNEKVLLYACIGTYTNYTLPENLYPGIRRIKCVLSSTRGTNFTTLPIAYFSVNTQTLSQSVSYTLHNAGFSFLKNAIDNISSWNFLNSIARKAETNLSKLTYDGSNNLLITGSVSVSNLPATQPISGSVSVSNFPATQPISGSVSVSSLPAIAITNTSFDVGNFPATQPISGSVSISSLPAIAITNTSFDVGNFTTTQAISGSVSVSNLPATQPISGSVSVSNLPTTQPISGSISVSNFPATQPISGSVSVSSLPAIAITNTSFNVGNFPATQPISGSVSVGNFPATQPVSGSVSVSSLPAIAITNTSFDVGNFPATQPISGSVSVSNFPATQPISGSVSVSSLPAIAITNTSFNVGNFPATQPISGSVSVSNASLDAHIYGSSDGTTWHHIKTDTNGFINNNSRTHDGTGNNITSTLIGSVRGLDVNIAGGSISVSSVSIKDSDGNPIKATDATNGILKSSIVDASNNAIVNIKATDTPTQSTQYLMPTTSTITANSYNYTTNAYNTTSRQVRAGVNDNDVVGLNMYQILPKIKTYTQAGRFTTSTNALFGGNNSNQTFTSLNWGKSNGKTFYASMNTTSRTLSYEYVDIDGNSGVNTVVAPTTGWSSALTLQGGASGVGKIVSINKWFSTTSLGTSDTVFFTHAVPPTTPNSANTISGGEYGDYYNGVMTVPNNCIMYITNVFSYNNGLNDLWLVKWDAITGARITVWNSVSLSNINLSASGATEGATIGGFFYAGESFGWGKNGATANNINATVVCRFLY
jgi:hypothetical protein